MVTCVDTKVKYRSILSNGNVTVNCDNPEAYGGAGIDFGPHDFLESAYATCLSAGTRKMLEREGIPFEQVIITVALDYHDDDKMFIRHKIEIKGVSKEVEADVAERAAANCLVRKNLCKELVFEPLTEENECSCSDGCCC